LFNRRLAPGSAVRAEAHAAIEALPAPLRAAVEVAMGVGNGRHFVSSDVAVSGVARGAVVLVGDAAGTCHPISASGMTMGIDDALRLQSALRRCDGELGKALLLYAAE